MLHPLYHGCAIGSFKQWNKPPQYQKRQDDLFKALIRLLADEVKPVAAPDSGAGVEASSSAVATGATEVLLGADSPAIGDAGGASKPQATDSVAKVSERRGEGKVVDLKGPSQVADGHPPVDDVHIPDATSSDSWSSSMSRTANAVTVDVDFAGGGNVVRAEADVDDDSPASTDSLQAGQRATDTVETVPDADGATKETDSGAAAAAALDDPPGQETAIMQAESASGTDDDRNCDNCVPGFAAYNAQPRKLRKHRTTKLNVSRNLNPFTIISCEHFSTSRIPQPFTIEVDSNAMLLMDLHCHLAETEVIGYLAGTWDKENQKLTVRKSFPCRALEGTDAEITSEREKTVEMDPLSETEAKEKIAEMNMCVLGWYHSHPVFKCEPSVRDIQNQQNYQNLFRDAESNEPFVGFIVAPYENAAINNKTSQVRCFWISKANDSAIEYGSPMLVEYTTSRSAVLEEELLHEIRALLAYYENFPQRQRMFLPAKRYSSTKAQTFLKIEKLISSLSAKLPQSFSEAAAAGFLDYVRSVLQEADALHAAELCQYE